MNFFEQLFHISPDGGNGMSELAVLAALAMAVAMAVKWSASRRAGRGRQRNR